MDLTRIALLKTRDDVLSLTWEDFLPDSAEEPAGIYMVQDVAGGILYVGKSSNIRARLRNPEHPIHQDCQLHRVKIFRVDDVELRGYCEYRFIDLLKPKWNKKGGQLVGVRVPDEILKIVYQSCFDV